MFSTRVCCAFFSLFLLGFTSCGPRGVIDRQNTKAVEIAAASEDTKQAEVAGDDPMTQISVINALMLGDYDGVMSIRDMLRHGDFGLGTLDHLDGELIVLAGTPYQVQGDGTVAQVDLTRSTPFAVVTKFEADGELRDHAIATLADLDQRLDKKIGHENNFLAIRLDGQFPSITVRSVKRQEPPYRPLAEVAKSQGVWTHEGLRGTLVGIRCPAWVQGLNVPGFHWHFISDDRRVGGHVLACEIRRAHIQYDICTNWEVILSDSEKFNKLDLSQDLRQKLEAVEKSRSDQPKE